MKIQRATVADAAAISALNATVQQLHAQAHPHIFKPPSPETFSPEAVSGILRLQDHVIFLATIDGDPAGYVYLQIVHRPESFIRHALDMIYIHHISVDKRYQGQGVGSALIEAAKQLADEVGISHLELDVWRFNAHAKRFFEGHGFAVYNERLWLDL